jgi:very-short-patch-repair endonuclease
MSEIRRFRNCYFVLRFLSEELSKHLDDVWDAIIRALEHQRRKVNADAKPQLRW